MRTETRLFPLKGHPLELVVSPGYLFLPNAVTGVFSRIVRIEDDDVVFDIGSGVGPLAIWSSLEPSREVHAVETIKEQYDLLLGNVKNHGLEDKVHAYHGKYFEPLPPGLKADVIIADVSGIAEGPARALGWYPPDIPTGGEDGTEVIVPLLEQASRYMADDARLYFPVAVDLSDSGKTMEAAERNFGKLERVAKHDFVLDPDQVEAMKPYMDIPYINLRTRRSRKTWRGEFYEVSEPKD